MSFWMWFNSLWKPRITLAREYADGKLKRIAFAPTLRDMPEKRERLDRLANSINLYSERKQAEKPSRKTIQAKPMTKYRISGSVLNHLGNMPELLNTYKVKQEEFDVGFLIKNYYDLESKISFMEDGKEKRILSNLQKVVQARIDYEKIGRSYGSFKDYFSKYYIMKNYREFDIDLLRASRFIGDETRTLAVAEKAGKLKPKKLSHA